MNDIVLLKCTISAKHILLMERSAEKLSFAVV